MGQSFTLWTSFIVMFLSVLPEVHMSIYIVSNVGCGITTFHCGPPSYNVVTPGSEKPSRLDIQKAFLNTRSVGTKELN
jgi:hypothetical protein